MSSIYEGALRQMGVKIIPKDALAQATLFAKLNAARRRTNQSNGNGNGKSAYKERGLQIVTWGNKGEGY